MKSFDESVEDGPTFTVWITKYALSRGVYSVPARACESDGMIDTPDKNGITGRQYFHGEGRDWHRTREGAEKKAEEMRLAKITSLKKQIKKLEALKW